MLPGAQRPLYKLATKKKEGGGEAPAGLHGQLRDKEIPSCKTPEWS